MGSHFDACSRRLAVLRQSKRHKKKPQLPHHDQRKPVSKLNQSGNCAAFLKEKTYGLMVGVN